VLRWDATQTFFLEPLLNREAWEDISSAESSTLAHEAMLRFRGQYAFDDRLIPQLEQIAGGFYTVRGYPEAVLAGDTVLMGTAEYRFHLPWSFGYQQQLSRDIFGRPFRAIPQQPYGRADWDLVLRGFTDFAYVVNSDRFFFESDEWLWGAGVGLELSFRRNATIRLDWGFVLDAIPGRANYGSNRLHVVAQFFF
jgi:hemolysin activation/secretion protein